MFIPCLKVKKRAQKIKMTDYDHFKSVVKHIVVKNKFKYQIKSMVDFTRVE